MTDQDPYADVTQQEVPASADREKDSDNVARGLEATLSNPQISDKGKQQARDKLDELDRKYPGDPDDRIPDVSSGQSKSSRKTEEGKDPGNVARGLKAAISNPGVSAEAKQNAERRLHEMEAA